MNLHALAAFGAFGGTSGDFPYGLDIVLLFGIEQTAYENSAVLFIDSYFDKHIEPRDDIERFGFVSSPHEVEPFILTRFVVLRYTYPPPV